MLKKQKYCLLGKEGLKLYNSLAKDIENETVQSIIDTWESTVCQKKSEIMDVLKLIACRQDDGEPLDKGLEVRGCDFGNHKSLKFIN